MFTSLIHLTSQGPLQNPLPTPPDVQYGYSEWFSVTVHRNSFVNEIVEDRKFQLKTDKKIGGPNSVWLRIRGADRFVLGGNRRLQATNCKTAQDPFVSSAPFYQQAGVLTFLKTSTQLQIWFDDVLEVNWVYVDAGGMCSLRRKMTGLKFQADRVHIDKVSTHYRYELGYYESLQAQGPKGINDV